MGTGPREAVPRPDPASREVKVCTRCQEVHPLRRFRKRTGTRDGLDYYCAYCRTAYEKSRSLYGHNAGAWKIIDDYHKAKLAFDKLMGRAGNGKGRKNRGV